MAFDDGQERAGSKEASFRMLPADQRFSANDGAGGHVHFGLVIEQELLASESRADALQIFMMSARGAGEPES